jgi:carbonic anhydrase
MTGKEIIQRLKAGNQRFVSDQLENPLQDSKRRGDLLLGQEPFAIILSCADSRVVPEIAFDTGLGELFVIRVAGNVANTETIASIEYAVAHCGTKQIIVMGHQSCGAVAAALAGGDNGRNINQLLDHISPAIESSSSKEVNEVVKVNVSQTIQVLKENSSIISEAIASGGLGIAPAYYELDTGIVHFL